jgi:hypothetical protein
MEGVTITDFWLYWGFAVRTSGGDAYFVNGQLVSLGEGKGDPRSKQCGGGNNRGPGNTETRPDNSNSGKSPIGGTTAIDDMIQDLYNQYITDLSKLQVLQDAIFDARALLEKRIVDINKWGTAEQQDFLAMFGTTDKSAKDEILKRINKMISVIDKYFIGDKGHGYREQFFETARDGAMIAHTYPQWGEEYEIFINQVFWSLSPTGLNGQTLTIIHELSHFRRTGSTDDFAYGLQNALNLAGSNSRKAMKNADNFALFIEGAR